jgi:hypothetical protein
MYPEKPSITLRKFKFVTKLLYRTPHVLFSLIRHKGNKKTLDYVRGNDLLTMNIKDEGHLSRLREDSVDGLTAQYRVQVLALY